MGDQEYNELRAELAEIRAMIQHLVGCDRMVSMKEAAEILDCSQATIRRRVHSGDLTNYSPPRKSMKFKLSELTVYKVGGKPSALSVLQ